MKVYATDEIRNVVLVGHGSVGKTTLAEAAMFVSGGTNRFGPANPTGLARSEKMGSVRNVTPSMRTSIVEWPIHVMLGLRIIATRLKGTRCAPPVRGTSEVHALRRKNGNISSRPGRSIEPSAKRGPCLRLACGGVFKSVFFMCETANFLGTTVCMTIRVKLERL